MIPPFYSGVYFTWRFSPLIVLFLAIGLWANAQEERIESVYFEFDKFDISKEQQDFIVPFVQNIDSTQVEKIEIFGYTDDRGKDSYNMILSQKRADAVKNLLMQNGVMNKIMVTIEGKGRVIINDDLDEHLPEARSKNRRVDVVVFMKPVPNEVLEIPGVYLDLQKSHVVGDRIYLEKITFDKGSSKLSLAAKKELDRVAKLMLKYKNLHFEIQGHVCCTPTFHKEAIDMETKKRELSVNRAYNVRKYLLTKRIDPKRLTAKGMGNTQPLGKSPHLDRRVELVVTKVSP